MKVNIKAFKKVTLMALMGLTVLLISPKSTDALSGSEFNAGRIIDDAVFFNSNSMSVAEIQNFLNSKVDCDFDGSEMVGGITRAQYAAQRGWPTTFTCLPQYKENIITKVNNIGSPNSNPAGSISAAQIIYNASAEHGVSSKALIVLLQKEQGLVTDEWPVPRQYQIATGYGCPDTAPCDEQYYGFYNQVNKAAFQFKRYVTNSSAYRYKAGQVNSIFWSPTTSCGSSNVYIENGATAALYNYTPYRPNAAALNNLYGTGDSCSAYGNRNFWRMFRDWFGSTFAVQYAAHPAGQSDYPHVRQGEKAPAYMRFTNVGSRAWYDDISAWGAGEPVVKLGTDFGLNRNSSFSSEWPSAHRASQTFGRVYNADYSLAANQNVVQPGQIAEFWFAFSASYSQPLGYYTEGFRPIVEGVGPMNNTGTFFGVYVESTIFSTSYVRQTANPSIRQGESKTVDIFYRNTGNTVWYDQSSSIPRGKPPVHLATDYSLNRNSNFSRAWSHPHRSNVEFSSVYESDGITLSPDQQAVLPNQVVKYSIVFFVPPGTPVGNYAEGFRPVVQGVGPMNDAGTWIGINVEQAIFSAQPVGQSPYPEVLRGQVGSGYLRYKNTGNVSWYDNLSAWSSGVLPVRLATDYPLNRNSQFSAQWFAPHRPAATFGRVYNSDGVTLATNQRVVAPGQVAEFWISFSASVNTPPGFYAEGFRPIVEGLGPMNDTGTWLGVTVR